MTNPKRLDTALWVAALIIATWFIVSCSGPTPAEVDVLRARCVVYGTEPVSIRYVFPYDHVVVYCLRGAFGDEGRWDATELPDPVDWHPPGRHRSVLPSYGVPPPPEPAPLVQPTGASA